jgi:pimeloyl-ACP methyl ester carboxylesterase
MHCNERGNGDAILFLHGMPTNGGLWDGVVRELSQSFRCLAVDLPGMGATRFVEYGPLYFEQVAAQIEEVRCRHGVRRWHIVGHDGGCAAAVHYAHLFPKRVGCMSLLSPAIFPDLEPYFLMEILRKPIVGEMMAPLVHGLFWGVAMRRAIPDKDGSQRAGFYNNFAGVAGPWRLMRLVRWGKPEEILQATPSILPVLACPTLVMHGSRDVLPETFAIRAANLIKNAQLITLDSGHFIPIERAAEVARHLRAYFGSQGANHAGESYPHHRAEPRSILQIGTAHGAPSMTP